MFHLELFSCFFFCVFFFNNQIVSGFFLDLFRTILKQRATSVITSKLLPEPF